MWRSSAVEVDQSASTADKATLLAENSIFSPGPLCYDMSTDVSQVDVVLFPPF